jgi:hypothetical protein
MAVGAIEPQFFAKLISGLGLAQDVVPNQFDLGRYDEMKAIFTERFATRTRDEWAAVFAGTDAFRHTRAHLDRSGRQRAPRGTVDGDHDRWRAAGRAGAPLLPDRAWTGRNAAEGHHRRRPDRLVAS